MTRGWSDTQMHRVDALRCSVLNGRLPRTLDSPFLCQFNAAFESLVVLASGAGTGTLPESSLSDIWRVSPSTPSPAAAEADTRACEDAGGLAAEDVAEFCVAHGVHRALGFVRSMLDGLVAFDDIETYGVQIATYPDEGDSKVVFDMIANGGIDKALEMEDHCCRTIRGASPPIPRAIDHFVFCCEPGREE